MRIVTNEKVIRRNGRIAAILTLGGLGALGYALYYTMTNMNEKGPASVNALLLMLVGFILSQIGMYFMNRWGRRPRVDQVLDQALKGLEDKYTILHYVTPVPHLLVGPAGVWALLPYYQGGKITYEKNRWRQKGGGAFQAYLRLFAQEGIGRPELEISATINSAQKFLAKKFPGEELPEVQAALVFTNARAEIDAENAPNPTIAVRDLKDTVRKGARQKLLALPKVKQITEVLEAGFEPVDDKK